MKFIKLLRLRINWNILTHALYVLLLFGIITFTIFGDSGIYQLHEMSQTKKKLEHQISESRAKIERLEEEKVLLTNPNYAESIIRKELGYIKEGEIVYQITHPTEEQ